MGDNIHRISDFENQPNQNRSRFPLLGSNINNYPNPRKEPFCLFLKNFFCPLSTVKSVMFVITMIDILVYIITLCFGIGISTPEVPLLLPPTRDTLDMFGELVKHFLTIE